MSCLQGVVEQCVCGVDSSALNVTCVMYSVCMMHWVVCLVHEGSSQLHFTTHGAMHVYE